MSAPESLSLALAGGETKRIACVCLPVLSLQLLWKRRPAWRGTPVAVVHEEGPDAPLMLLSREAKRLGLRSGLTAGAARNLVPGLRVGVVRPDELQQWTLELAEALGTFSPRVEKVREEVYQGAFWIDPEGLEKIYGGYGNWAQMITGYLGGRGLVASAVVGFHPYRCMALARQRRGAVVLESRSQELELAKALGLRSLGFPERLCEPLERLDIQTLGAFLELPPGELHTRFGAEAASLHGRFGEARQLPLQPLRFESPRRLSVEVQPPTAQVEPLLFAIKGALDRLLADLEQRGERLTQLTMSLRLEAYGNRKGAPIKLREEEREVVETLEPSSPLDESSTLLELVRLRLGKKRLLAPVEELILEADAVVHAGEQQRTPGEAPKRDPRAAERALARVRAAFGNRAVVRAELRDGHLPEACFRFVPLEQWKETPEPGGVQEEEGQRHENLLVAATRGASRNAPGAPGFREARPVRRKRIPLQRRVLRRPKPLPSTAQGWPLLDGVVGHVGEVVDLDGPQRLSGGWWGKQQPAQRDYYYAETEEGGLFWVYWDRPRSRWFLHGHVD